MLRKLMCVVMVSFFPLFLIGQVSYDFLDSLKLNLNVSNSPIDSLNILLEICNKLDVDQSAYLDSLKKYATLSLALSEANQKSKESLLSKYHLSNAVMFSDSMEYFSLMTELRDNYLENNDFLSAAQKETRMAFFYAYKLQLDKIRMHCLRAIDIISKEPKPNKEHHSQKALALYYIANSYNYGEAYDEALSYALKVESLASTYDLPKRLMMAYEIIGKIYLSLSEIYLTENNYSQKAEEYLIKSYKFSKESAASEVAYGASFHLGRFYYFKENYVQAKQYLEESLGLVKEHNNTAFEYNNSYYLAATTLKLNEIDKAFAMCQIAESLNNSLASEANERAVDQLYAEIHLAKKEFKVAKKFAKKANSNSSLSQNPEGQLSLLRLLETIELANGNYKAAIKFDKQADVLQDSILNAKTLNNIQQIENKKTLAEKEQEIYALQNEKELSSLIAKNKLLSISGILFLIIASLICFLLYNRNKRIQREKNFVQLEQKLLRSQMNPHFVFNVISSIQNYLYDKNDLSIALNYMSKFGDLMRQTLENSREEYILIENELASLKNYLEMQKLRYSNKFDYEIIVDEDIELDRLMVPPLIAQPFVENSIEHGMIYRVKGGKVTITFAKNNDNVLLTILDNGVANRKLQITTERTKKPRKSLANKITKERLSHISKTQKQRFQIISEIIAEGGTRININLPIVLAS